MTIVRISLISSKKSSNGCTSEYQMLVLIFILTLTIDEALRPLCGRTNLCNIIMSDEWQDSKS